MATDFPYRVERLNAENIYDLIPLFKGVFGKTVSREYVRAKYDTAYLGVQYLAHICYEGDTPIAYYGAMPFMIEYNGRQILAAQSGDAMTLPGYNGKGIFTHLGRMTDALLEAENIAFVYGWPNQNSYYGYVKKLDWVHKENMQRYEIPVRCFPLEKLSRMLPRLRPWYKKRARKLLASMQSSKQALPSSVVDGEWGGTLRNEAFFKYKAFLGNVLADVEGVTVWLKADTRLLIGDMQLASEAEMLKAEKTLKKLARKLGVPAIIFQVSPGAPLDRWFGKRYQPIESWAIGYKNYLSDIPLEKLRFTYGDLDTF